MANPKIMTIIKKFPIIGGNGAEPRKHDPPPFEFVLSGCREIQQVSGRQDFVVWTVSSLLLLNGAMSFSMSQTTPSLN